MKERKFADLSHEQIKEVIHLEEKLEVTLLAYDLYSHEGNLPQENDTPIINPS